MVKLMATTIYYQVEWQSPMGIKSCVNESKLTVYLCFLSRKIQINAFIINANAFKHFSHAIVIIQRNKSVRALK